MRRMVMLLPIVIVAATLTVRAQKGDEPFKKGLDARDDKKWQDVVTHMRAAIKAESTESTRKVRRGLKDAISGSGTEYLPHFFLGEALARTGECVGALDAWATSEKHAAVSGERLSEIKKGRAECAKAGVLTAEDFTRAYDTANKSYQDARRIYSRVDELSKGAQRQTQVREQLRQANDELGSAYKHLQDARSSRKSSELDLTVATARKVSTSLLALEATLAREGDARRRADARAADVERSIASARAVDGELGAAPLTAAQKAARSQALAQLTDAEKGLQAWRQEPGNMATLDTAARVVESATASLVMVRDEALKRMTFLRGRQQQELERAGLDALTALDGSFSTYAQRAAANPALVQPEMTAEQAELQKKAATLRRQFERASATATLPALSKTPALAAEIKAAVEALIGRFGPLSLRDRGVPESLENGVRLFLSGDYRQSLGALEDPAAAEGPLRLHVHLIRAAAQYALFVRSGEKEKGLLTSATSEIEQAKALDPAFRPDPRAFAPSFLALYDGRPKEKAPLPR